VTTKPPASAKQFAWRPRTRCPTGFHLWYEHVCAGSVPAGDMRRDPEALAQKLVELHALFKDSN